MILRMVLGCIWFLIGMGTFILFIVCTIGGVFGLALGVLAVSFTSFILSAVLIDRGTKRYKDVFEKGQINRMW